MADSGKQLEKELATLTLEDGRRIIVEVESGEAPPPSQTRDKRLPAGAEANKLGDDFSDGVALIREQIGALADTVSQALQDNAPDEWSVEINLGFKGKTNPIPFILGAEASGGVKVTAKWKKN